MWFEEQHTCVCFVRKWRFKLSFRMKTLLHIEHFDDTCAHQISDTRRIRDLILACKIPSGSPQWSVISVFEVCFFPYVRVVRVGFALLTRRQYYVHDGSSKIEKIRKSKIGGPLWEVAGGHLMVPDNRGCVSIKFWVKMRDPERSTRSHCQPPDHTSRAHLPSFTHTFPHISQTSSPRFNIQIPSTLQRILADSNPPHEHNTVQNVKLRSNSLWTWYHTWNLD